MNARDKELAKQAWTENDWDGHVDLAKFIQLVRADEREACADAVVQAVEKGLQAAIAMEREACAIMADECVNIENLGAAIRARGNT